MTCEDGVANSLSSSYVKTQIKKILCHYRERFIKMNPCTNQTCARMQHSTKSCIRKRCIVQSNHNQFSSKENKI